MSVIRLSTFLYERQQGRCYLMTSGSCRALDGYLHPDQLGKGAKHERGWTWEHVIPKFVQTRIGGGASLKLLACERCNMDKGSKLPTEKHIALALALYADYSALPHRDRGGADHSRAVRLVTKYRAWLRPAMSDDPDVPNTVEEALAQGGIKA